MLSTFSRAAWIAWFLQTFILIILQYKRTFLKVLVRGILPLLLLFGIITFIGKDQIIGRTFSNTGHFRMIAEAIEKIKEKPIWGQGAGSA